MIAKEVAKRDGGGSFGGLVAYLTDDQGKQERVGRVRITNCASVDAPSVVLEVLNTQARNRRARDLNCHVILSFRAGEQPGASVLEQIEDQVCAALGFSEHQRVSIVHHDTDNLHVHVAINRVHPRRFTVECSGFSRLKLDALCVELEREFGLQRDRHHILGQESVVEAKRALTDLAQRQCAEALKQALSWADVHDVARGNGLRLEVRGNGLVFVDAQGTSIRASSVARELSRAALEKRLGPLKDVPTVETAPRMTGPARRQPDMEALGDIEGLVGWVQRRCAPALLRASSWRELHAVARAHGLRVQLRGNGLVFCTDRTARQHAIKASSISRELSKHALERKFGPFEVRAPASQGEARPPAAAYERGPHGKGGAEAYRRYLRERELQRVAQERAMQRLLQQRGRARARLDQDARRRWAAIRLMAKGRVAWKLWIVQARLAARRDRVRLEQGHRSAARAIARAHSSPTWVDWLRSEALRGEADALAALRCRRRGELANNDSIRVGDDAPIFSGADGITRSGAVIYAVPGGTVRDDGHRLHLFAEPTLEATRALLRLACARGGVGLVVDGSARFSEQVAGVLAEFGGAVGFANASLKARRQGVVKESNHGRRGLGAEYRGAGPPDGKAWLAERFSKHTRDERTADRRWLPKRDACIAASRAATAPSTRVRGVSEIDVARLERDPQVLLPRDARDHVDQRGAAAVDSGLRRDPARARVTRTSRGARR